jgi:MFS family permease
MGGGLIAGGLLITSLQFHVVFITSSFLCIGLVCSALFLRPAAVSIEPLSRYFKDLTARRVLLFSLALFLFYLHWGAEIACYAPFLKQELHLNLWQTGLFMGIPVIFLAFCTYYFGWLRDRGQSSIRLAVIAIIFSAAGIILFSLSRNPLVSFLFRLVHEFGDAAFVIFTYVGIAQLFPRQRLGGTSGSMYVVMIGAQSVGSLVFSWLGGEYGYTMPYIISGIASLSAIPLIVAAHTHYRFAMPTEK